MFEGAIVDVIEGEFRHEDGETVSRQWVAHPGSVAIVAHDGERLWLVRQPREATGDSDLLELPAGKLDEAGEDRARVRAPASWPRRSARPPSTGST